jgi:hypothetical protein
MSNTSNQPLDAEERLVHALLIHLNDAHAVEHREQRVGRAIQAIVSGTERKERSKPAMRLHNVPWSRRLTWAMAAMLLLAAGIYLTTGRSSSAKASVTTILNSLDRPGDRTYLLHVEPAASADSPRHGLDGSTLYLRSGKQYVLVRKNGRGQDLFDGFDGQQSWRIRGGVLVEEKNGPGAGGLPLPKLIADVPLSDLSQTLAELGTSYTINHGMTEPLKPGADGFVHIIATRKSQGVKGPPMIEIWADAHTGIPKRIVFDQAKFQGSLEPRQLTLELISEISLSANWFAPASHVATSRS